MLARGEARGGVCVMGWDGWTDGRRPRERSVFSCHVGFGLYIICPCTLCNRRRDICSWHFGDGSTEANMPGTKPTCIRLLLLLLSRGHEMGARVIIKEQAGEAHRLHCPLDGLHLSVDQTQQPEPGQPVYDWRRTFTADALIKSKQSEKARSEEHTSELQSQD